MLIKGRPFELAPLNTRILLVIEMTLPLLIAIVFWEQAWVFVESLLSLELGTFLEYHKLGIQLSMLTIWAIVRLICFPHYVKTYLNASTRMFAVQLASGSKDLDPFHLRVTVS